MNTIRVVDLYPASSNSTVRLVSFWMVVINACSWPSQCSYFSRKFHPPLVIVHPRPGSRHWHVVRPSVVMIFVSFTRSSHTCDESKILPKPPSGISWSTNQVFPFNRGVSCSRRRRGSYTKGAYHCMCPRLNSKNFLLIGLLTMSGWCVEFCLEGSISLLHSLCSIVRVFSSSLLQHFRSSSKMKSVVAGAKWYATKLSRTLWLLSKFFAWSLLSPCALPHLSVSRKGPFCPI